MNVPGALALLGQLEVMLSDQAAPRDLVRQAATHLAGDEFHALLGSVSRPVLSAPPEELGKALLVTLVGIGTAPGPEMVRECVRLSREFYSELATPTTRSTVADPPSGFPDEEEFP